MSCGQKCLPFSMQGTAFASICHKVITRSSFSSRADILNERGLLVAQSQSAIGAGVIGHAKGDLSRGVPFYSQPFLPSLRANFCEKQ